MDGRQPQRAYLCKAKGDATGDAAVLAEEPTATYGSMDMADADYIED